jgi:hypothetical protein
MNTKSISFGGSGSKHTEELRMHTEGLSMFAQRLLFGLMRLVLKIWRLLWLMKGFIFLVLMTLIPLIDFLFTAKWHISGILVFGKKLKIPARKVYEGDEGEESVKI